MRRSLLSPSAARFSGAIVLLIYIVLVGCGGSSSTSTSATTPNSGVGPVPQPPVPVADIWQNPFMALNPGNNVHNDSYMSDSYAYAGPTTVSRGTVDQMNIARFIDPVTGQARTALLGECAGQAFDPDGNIMSYSACLPDPRTDTVTRSIVTVDRKTLGVLAYAPYTVPCSGSLTDFGGAGYYYQDQLGRMVAGMPGRKRQKSAVSPVDRWVEVKSHDVGGTIPVPSCQTELSLYAVVPDKAGNTWFTTGQAVVGTISPAGQIRWMDLDDPTGTGACQPQADGQFQAIANSHAVDEGDSPDQPSGVYILTTYRLYRLQTGADGSPEIVWQADYDHGPMQKPGQVSFGSGSSPTVFHMGGRRFVTILDNAASMHVNVYRAEAQLAPGEQRLFAQTVAFPNLVPGTNAARPASSRSVTRTPRSSTAVAESTSTRRTTGGTPAPRPSWPRGCSRPAASSACA